MGKAVSASASSKTTAVTNGSASAARSLATASPAAFCCSVLRPNIPTQAREAEELYLPLAGHAFWRSDGLAASSAGDMEPPSLDGHPAMRSSNEPPPAAYVWRAGDLTAKSRIGR